MQAIPTELLEKLKSLPEVERDQLIRAGIYEAALGRMQQLEREIEECKGRISSFETKYGMTFQEFESGLLQKDDALQVHEDYNDWFYWKQVLEEKNNFLPSFSYLIWHDAVGIA